MEIIRENTDVLIIGGGAAGCQAAIFLKEKRPNLDILIIEKANIRRSGCLAAGVNAINAYLGEGESPNSYVDYVKEESSGLIREDLTYTIGKKLNEMTEKLEEYGLPFLKDEDGNYVGRGKRSIKINGESIKPILAEKTISLGTRILNKTMILDYIVKNNKIYGAYAVSEGKFYYIKAKFVICATGGVAGIYKPNNLKAKNKMWYPPFNTGAGFAMGLRAGAEMTSFEMRFIALRTKDTISPTGTIAQGVKASQVNGKYEKYMQNYENKKTPLRLYATVKENQEGRGPCYLDTRGIKKEDIQKLKEAYLSMSPSIILKWKDEDKDISKEGVEICGSEPYIVGGHGQAGYWVNTNRESTIENLYAAGDVVGGSPKKYVTGAMAEGEIAGEDILRKIDKIKNEFEISNQDLNEIMKTYLKIFNYEGLYEVEEVENGMQKIMDEYAGGISSNYGFNEEKLLIARKYIKDIEKNLLRLKIKDYREFIKYYELKDKLLIARTLIEHLLYRKETRWKSYQENLSYPNLDNENWFKFVNSIYDIEKDEIKIIERNHKKLGDYNVY